MKKNQQISLFFFYSLVALLIVISAYTLIGAISRINKPFPGFLLYQAPYVGSMGVKDWPGPTAGIRFLDRILVVDGQPVNQSRDVWATVRQKSPGAPVDYRVASKQGMRTITVPVTLFGLRDFFLVFLIPYLGGVLIWALGIAAWVMKPNVRVIWIFFGMCLSLGGYMVTGFDVLSSYHLVRFHYAVLSFYPAFFLHLGLIFPEKKRILLRRPLLEYFVYLPAVVLCIGYQIYFSVFEDNFATGATTWVPDYTTLGVIARVYTLVYFSSLIAILFHSYFKATSLQARQRARIIVFGLIVGSLPPALIMAFAFFLKAEFPWNFLPFFVVFFPASFAYAIVRHNLFDADAIIRRTVGYFLATSVIIGVYVLVSVGLNVFLGHYQLAQSKAFPIVFTLLVIFVFNPLRDRIQIVVDRLFFRKEYDYSVIVEKISGAMTSLLDLNQILKKLLNTFTQDMFVSTGAVMLLNSDRTTYRVAMADGDRWSDVEKISFQRNEPLMEVIEIEKKELTRYDLLEDQKYKDVCEECELNFESLNASLMVPMVYQGQIIGMLSLGDKKSGKSFNREDIDLLRTIAHQGSVAIENARLFQENLEKQRMEDELNIARELQMSMLPNRCPEIEGFEIAATSIPAREVGGDFYDFIKLGKERIGVVIGDVTGKSVSGALVVSASRSVLRMLTEENYPVGEIMVRANRRAKKDMQSGMFVALLYAELKADALTISLCSAGQTQPILFSAEDHSAALVETTGDTFPLGILPEADYQETTLALNPGDKVLFYTDGIVEAMNTKQEIFGFERLLSTVKASGVDSPTSILDSILENVRRFADGAAQHDDLTLIVVGRQERTQ